MITKMVYSIMLRFGEMKLAKQEFYGPKINR